LSFTPAGALSTAMPLNQSYTLANGASSPMSFTLDLTGTSQYGLAFGVNQLLQDGYTSGRLSGISVASDGTIQGRYSNGKSRNMGQLVLANFNNSNGLQSLGGNQWAESAESGQPIPGTPGSGSLGVIQSSSVEESNVDLTAELVNMITQQRVYQANAQTIKTEDQVLQTLVNLR
jgi:flagellar hook protein FlgE